jgi:hypothetical protein
MSAKSHYQHGGMILVSASVADLFMAREARDPRWWAVDAARDARHLRSLRNFRPAREA